MTDFALGASSADSVTFDTKNRATFFSGKIMDPMDLKDPIIGERGPSCERSAAPSSSVFSSVMGPPEMRTEV